MKFFLFIYILELIFIYLFIFFLFTGGSGTQINRDFKEFSSSVIDHNYSQEQQRSRNQRKETQQKDLETQHRQVGLGTQECIQKPALNLSLKENAQILQNQKPVVKKSSSESIDVGYKRSLSSEPQKVNTDQAAPCRQRKQQQIDQQTLRQQHFEKSQQQLLNYIHQAQNQSEEKQFTQQVPLQNSLGKSHIHIELNQPSFHETTYQTQPIQIPNQISSPQISQRKDILSSSLEHSFVYAHDENTCDGLNQDFNKYSTSPSQGITSFFGARSLVAGDPTATTLNQRSVSPIPFSDAYSRQPTDEIPIQSSLPSFFVINESIDNVRSQLTKTDSKQIPVSASGVKHSTITVKSVKSTNIRKESTNNIHKSPAKTNQNHQESTKSISKQGAQTYSYSNYLTQSKKDSVSYKELTAESSHKVQEELHSNLPLNESGNLGKKNVTTPQLPNKNQSHIQHKPQDISNASLPIQINSKVKHQEIVKPLNKQEKAKLLSNIEKQEVPVIRNSKSFSSFNEIHDKNAQTLKVEQHQSKPHDKQSPITKSSSSTVIKCLIPTNANAGNDSSKQKVHIASTENGKLKNTQPKSGGEIKKNVLFSEEVVIISNEPKDFNNLPKAPKEIPKGSLKNSTGYGVYHNQSNQTQVDSIDEKKSDQTQTNKIASSKSHTVADKATEIISNSNKNSAVKSKETEKSKKQSVGGASSKFLPKFLPPLANRSSITMKSAQEGLLVAACKSAEEDQVLKLVKDLSSSSTHIDVGLLNQTDKSGRVSIFSVIVPDLNSMHYQSSYFLLLQTNLKLRDCFII